MFIAVDGIDGAGKTTLVNTLKNLLSPLNPVITKEPTGNSRWGQRLRRAAAEGRLPREKEIKYFHKDRLHHINKVIAPAIAEHRPVITDRYVDSTLAFQTNNPEEANRLYEKFLPEILVPDLTFILVCPVETGIKRILFREHRELTQYETVDTLETARIIYESRRGPNYVHLNATGTAEDTFLQAIETLKERFVHLKQYVNKREEDSSDKKWHVGSVA